MKLILFIFLISFCAPLKDDVSEIDVKKIVDRLASVRLYSSLDPKEKNQKTDKEIFYEICKIMRLKPELVLEKIKKSDTVLYEHIVYEK
jgi:hypothetical protein